jgi:hypothetical protein
MEQRRESAGPLDEGAHRRAVEADDVGVGPGRGSGIASARFPGPPSAPDVGLSSHPALHGLPPLCGDRGGRCAGPRCGDVMCAPPIPSNRNGGGVEHDDPVLLRTITWPAGQEMPVEIRPRDPFVPFEQPLGDPVAGKRIEVSEGRFRHTVTEIRTPSSGSTDTARLLGAACHPSPSFPAIGCPDASSGRCDGPTETVSHHLSIHLAPRGAQLRREEN